jgi:hypothetical protein
VARRSRRRLKEEDILHPFDDHECARHVGANRICVLRRTFCCFLVGGA